MKTHGGSRQAAESLYVQVEATGSPLSRVFGWAVRLLGAALAGVIEFEPSAVLRIRSRLDDVVVYEEKYRLSFSEAVVAKGRFEDELRTLTVEQFEERYTAS